MKEKNRRDFIKTLLTGSAVLSLSLQACGEKYEQQEVKRKPNFVFILIDDLGWTDLSCYGSTFYKTPHIDKLASQGMKFTDAYAACPVCSPTRASILTGKYPARIHLTDWIAGYYDPEAKLSIPDWKKYLDNDEVTLAEALKAAGYVSANIGKWHLGGEDYYPRKHGFDVNIAGYNAGQPPNYFYPYENKTRDFNTYIPYLEGGKEGEYLTDRLTDEAEKFLDKNRDNPFFLYLSHYAVHTPIQGKKELIEKYMSRIKPRQAQHIPDYAAMV